MTRHILIEVGLRSMNIYPEHLQAMVNDTIFFHYMSKNIDDRQAWIGIKFREGTPFDQKEFNFSAVGIETVQLIGTALNSGDFKYDVEFTSKDFRIDVDPYIHIL